ncbi:MAG: class I mannose-6-phosphate isomerase [Phycisphaerales bacterium]|nr:class I mannose-6-phosphate isomerase [Phycisphaerae bacterium]NNF42793.1 class I mannose-6-phosphate isomerase [Phycisphaerales bacterium]NNM27702.1 class I mannose-6-phosphate isomerase [Phycisphaerales bacterium]
MTALYPLVLTPILKPRVWGGRRLADLGKLLPPETPIGESWELADLPDSIEDGRSVIANGPWTGRTLRDAIAADRGGVLGQATPTPEGGFPLLLKYLDARENLSVQVHPTPAYVASHPGTAVKSEAWIVLAAEPDAVIYRGLQPGVTAETLASNIASDAVIGDLRVVPAVPGTCHYLPSGTCHALGAGVLVAEVQTPSDTTFRVYDWGRSGRALHIEQALACIDFTDDRAEGPPAPEPIETDGVRLTPLAETPHFSIDRVEVIAPASWPVITNELPVAWMVTRGAGLLRGGDVEVIARTGMTIVWPAGVAKTHASMDAGSELIEIRLPSPLKNMIA